MTLAWLSLGALAIAMIVSCTTQLNVGVLALALAWLVGVYFGGMRLEQVAAGFPVQLFLTLAGVTLLFTQAQLNGTLDRIAHAAVRICRGNAGLIPVMFFLLGCAIASVGPGNVSTAAMLAPMAMSVAARASIPPFLMAIMVGNGANSGALSPFAPTGIIVNGLMARNGLPGLEWRTFIYNFAAHVLVAFSGYALFGGLKLFSAGRADADEVLDGTPTTFQRRHWITTGVILLVILGVVVGKANVGMCAFLGAVILVLSGSADDGEAVKKMPWRVIVMVCGVTVLIALVERTQGIDLMVSLVARVASAQTVTGVIAFFTGIVSVYSSTSGVVLPAFLPLVPGLAAQLPGASPVAIATAMNVGGHLVDVSPLSTLGALCLAGAPPDDSRALFNKLLAWGLSMAVVGAILCYLIF
jgi:di/tricarboxylate transporter